MKYCDLVMKGGITSGIVYPNAVLALARHYRFKNIGGTSAGAIAAAASAAAAYGDRCKKTHQAIAYPAGEVGFEGLKDVAAELATEGFIYGLFKPARGAGAAYRMLVTLAGKATTMRKAWVASAAVLLIAPLELLGPLVLLLGLGYWLGGVWGMAATLLPSLVCAYAVGVVAAVMRTARVARSNLLGLCNGTGGSPDDPALTEWLHRVLQRLSGKAATDLLTFQDLWDAPRYRREPKTKRALSLQMITTAVSHHEPRTLPFEKGSFWFREAEFAKLFPHEVVERLVKQAGEPVKTADGIYYRLPQGGALPVLVGMRMSLSFPLLISAVPLHEPADVQKSSRAPAAAAAAAAPQAAPVEHNLSQSMDSLAASGGAGSGSITSFRVCWFSDGGISSNFPIHLFDAPLPVWPTFAIDLVYPDKDGQSADQPEIYLPASNNEGWERPYEAIARSTAVTEIAAFLFGIVGTMQNWRDLLLARAPGQRDRIVHIALKGDEGGMNLNMPQSVLDSISDKGTRAGLVFRKFKFDNHYWIRWRNLAASLQRFTIRVSDSVHSTPAIRDYEQAYATARTGTPPPVSYKFRSQAQIKASQDLLDRLATEGEEWEDLGPDLTAGAPRPTPQLQISPIF